MFFFFKTSSLRNSEMAYSASLFSRLRPTALKTTPKNPDFTQIGNVRYIFNLCL